MQFNTFGLPEIIATIAVVMNVSGYLMKTMVPLRILAIITNLLNLLGVSPFVQMLAMGVIIVVAVVISDMRNRQR